MKRHSIWMAGMLLGTVQAQGQGLRENFDSLDRGKRQHSGGLPRGVWGRSAGGGAVGRDE